MGGVGGEEGSGARRGAVLPAEFLFLKGEHGSAGLVAGPVGERVAVVWRVRLANILDIKSRAERAFWCSSWTSSESRLTLPAAAPRADSAPAVAPQAARGRARAGAGRGWLVQFEPASAGTHQSGPGTRAQPRDERRWAACRQRRRVLRGGGEGRRRA